jgi:hypothetical protein
MSPSRSLVPPWLARLFRPWRLDPPAPPIEPPSAGPVTEPARLLEVAIDEHRRRRFDVAEPLFRAVIDDPAASDHDRHVARNIYGNLLERTRRVDQAVDLYEANLAERFNGSYPYERLAAIYGKRGRQGDVLRVLRQGVQVVQAELEAGDPARRPQLERLRDLLSEAEQRTRR